MHSFHMYMMVNEERGEIDILRNSKSRNGEMEKKGERGWLNEKTIRLAELTYALTFGMTFHLAAVTDIPRQLALEKSK